MPWNKMWNIVRPRLHFRGILVACQPRALPTRKSLPWKRLKRFLALRYRPFTFTLIHGLSIALVGSFHLDGQHQRLTRTVLA
jgi:hypothetical protein